MKPIITTNYIVTVNDEFYKAFSSLGEARNFVKNFKLTDIEIEQPESMKIIKQRIIDRTMDVYDTEKVALLIRKNK